MADSAHPVTPNGLDAVAADFVTRAKVRDLSIGVLGLGYVGLPLAIALIRAGFRVTGFDVDQEKVTTLTEGRSYIKHIPETATAAMAATGRFTATTDFDTLSEPDAVLICVPTPIDHHRNPDLAFVVSSTEYIAKRLRRGQLIVLESTTYPGTSEEVMIPILEKASGLKAHVDFAIAYSPEREDPGNPNFETSSIPKVVGANTDAERQMAAAVYEAIVPQVVAVSDLATAEAVKVTENIFRWVNIGLVNELKVVFDRMGIDVWEVIDAAATKPFGFMPFYPGPGLGGHCIPIDPFYLSWRARAFGMNTRFIELAGEVNGSMPQHVVARLAEALNDKSHKAVARSRVLVVGLAYKKNVDDMRESPSLQLIHLLQARSAEVSYYDPYIPVVPTTREHPEYAGMRSIEWDRETLSQFDAALIATDHDDVDYKLLCEVLPVVVDTRNATRLIHSEFEGKIYKA